MAALCRGDFNVFATEPVRVPRGTYVKNESVLAAKPIGGFSAPAWTWHGDSYCPTYIPSATGESVNPVLNAIAFKVLPNTVGATPFDAGIMCGPVCVGG